MTSGFLSQVIGGWRISAIQIYSSGTPIALTRNNSLSAALFNGQNRPIIDGYDNWRAPIKGDKFDPAVDTFLKPASQFPVQSAGRVRQLDPIQSQGSQFLEQGREHQPREEFSYHRKFPNRFRAEAFNILNRTVFGTGSTNLNSATFGVVPAR